MCHTTRSRARLFVILAAVAVVLFTPGTVAQLRAEPLSTPGLFRFVLSNGLEVFVFENHVVPLATIQITFRCGSITQTPQTAGLFHLYEHMLFKGNRVYRTEAEFQAAMKEIGVAGWNGGTSNEQVSYFFTVPSAKVALGLAFWANAVRYPLFDPVELATEKKVVVNEIRGYLNNPDDIFESGMDRRLYYEYPWRRDVSGSESNIRNATVEILRSIQNRYYIPNNAALFVGGDVNPEHVRQLAEETFGGWKRGSDPWLHPLPPHPAPPQDRFLAFGDDQMYQGVAQVTARFRGPDVLDDTQATYAADVWGKLMDDPNGRFRDNLMAKVPGLYNRDYIWAYYYTQRDGGLIDFTTYMLLDPHVSTYQRARDLLAVVREEFRRMADDPSYFPKADFEVVKAKSADEKLIEQETASGMISNLSFWWASANTSYYLGYVDNLGKVTVDDLAEYLRHYLTDAKAIVGVRINPADLRLDDAQAHGFQELDRSSAFWWNVPPDEGSLGGSK